MTRYLVAAIFISFCKLGDSSGNVKSIALRNALKNISQGLGLKNRFVSVVFDGASTDVVHLDVLESFAGIPHVVARFEDSQQRFSNLNSSAIVLLESFESLKTFNNRTVLSSTFSTQQQLFIFCRHGTVNEIVRLKDTSRFHTPIIQYEYFVVEEEKWIRLVTFVWYTPENCGPQLVEVNKFEKSTGKWKERNYLVDKFSNFHGCRIYFKVENAWPEFSADEIDYVNQEITECSGYNCAILKDFSSSLNYSYHFNMYLGETTFFPDIYTQLTVSSVFCNVKVTVDEDNKFLLTRPIFFMEEFITVPPGEEFNEYEKMLLPFDEETWMWIGITFFAAFVTIFVLRFVNANIANFVIGEGTATPALNVLRAFFGISQIVCPARNFARYLLMLFIWFSLIVRTAYQGKMFEFLQKEIRKPTVTTIEEMIEQNFTFYMLPDSKFNFQELDLYKRGNVIDEWTYSEFYAAFERTYISGSKIATVYMKDMYSPVVRFQMNRTDPPKLLEKRLQLLPKSLVFRPLHFLFESFDRKLQQYIEADLVNFNIRAWNERTDPKRFKVDKEPFAVLTLGELEAGFVVCLVPLVLSIFVFGIEWLQTLKDFIVLLFIFQSYFDLKFFEQKRRRKLVRFEFAEFKL